MNEQEAIKSMENLNLVLSITDSERESVNMAIKALEKQIPKKVLLCRNMMTKENVFVCPSCNRIVESTNFHCWNCGQKLDWSDEE